MTYLYYYVRENVHDQTKETETVLMKRQNYWRPKTVRARRSFGRRGGAGLCEKMLEQKTQASPVQVATSDLDQCFASQFRHIYEQLVGRPAAVL